MMTTKKPYNWLTAVGEGRPMSVSPSALVTFMGSGVDNPPCKRKWWLQKVRKLKAVSKQQHGFGTVTHSVCERFLDANELGIDTDTGEPVILFPPGWEIPESRFGDEGAPPLTLKDQELIQTLISKAITNGTLQRKPGGIAEQEYSGELLTAEVPARKGGSRKIVVKVWASADYISYETVEDHKTCKNVKYLKKPKTLEEDVQMRSYGYLEHCWQKTKSPKTIWLVHNQYLKDINKEPRKCEVEITTRKLKHWWSTRIEPSLKEMASIRENARTYLDVPEACSPRACQAFGGCEFQEICDHKLSEKDFEIRVANQKERNTLGKQLSKSLSKSLRENKGTKMGKSIFDKMGKKPGNNPPAPKPEAASAKKTSPKNPAAGSVQKGTAPWAVEGCTICSKFPLKGFNKQGGVCALCNHKRKNSASITSSDYTITVEDDRISWEPATEKAIIHDAEQEDAGVSETVDSPTENAAEEQPETVEETPDTVKEEAAEPDAGETVKPEAKKPATSKPTSAAKPKARKAGEKVSLFINCRPSKGVTSVKSGLEVFEEIKSAIAESQGEASYYGIDVFKRRDMLSMSMSKLVEDNLLGSKIAAEHVSNSADDYGSFIKALRPCCDVIVEATA